MQLTLIIPKLQAGAKTSSDVRRAARVSEAAALIMSACSFSIRSTRNREKHSGGRRRSSL